MPATVSSFPITTKTVAEEAVAVRGMLGVVLAKNEVKVLRASVFLSGFTAYLGNDPNGEYVWNATDGCHYKDGVAGGFKLTKNSGYEINYWYLKLGTTTVAQRTSFELVGEWVVSVAEYGTYGYASLSPKAEVFHGVQTDISLIVNEACYGDTIILGHGVYIYGGLPYVYIGGFTDDAVGNHRYHVGDLTIVSAVRRGATIKFVQSQSIDLMNNGGGASIRMFWGGGKMQLIDLILDVNARQNIDTWWTSERGWVWGETNLGLNPFYGPYALRGDHSIVSGCHLINWTAGGTNLVGNGAEQAPVSFFGYYCAMTDCLVTDPVDVSTGFPYLSLMSSRFGCRYERVEANLPDTHDDYWIEGTDYGAGSTGTFAFGVHDGSVYINCKARNFVKMFHRDTLPVTNCVIIGNTCVNCRYGVGFQMSEDCRNIYIAHNQFSLFDRGTDKGVGVTILGFYSVDFNPALSGITIEHNTIIGYSTSSLGVQIGSAEHPATGVVLRNNTMGVWDNPTDHYGRQVIGTLDCIVNGSYVGAGNYQTDPLELQFGGTGAESQAAAKTALGLDYYVAPSTEPPVYGALWNNNGVIAIAAGDADSAAYITAVETALGSSLSSVDKAAIDTFVRAEKLAARWTKHKRIFLPVWGNAAANAIPMTNPASVGTWVGTVTHAAGYAQGNGSTGYMDSGVSLGALGLTLSSGYFFALAVNNQTAPNGTYVGVGTSTSGAYMREGDTGAYLQGAYVVDTGAVGRVTVTTTKVGVLSFSREGGYRTLAKRNAAGVTTLIRTAGANSAAALSSANVFFMALNGLNTPGTAPVQYNNGQLGAFGISTGLTQAEDADFTLNLKTLWETVTGLTLA